MKSHEESQALKSAILTELQAIAIYESECAVLKMTCWTAKRKKSLQAFQSTLLEEREHRDSLKAHFPRPIHPFIELSNRWAGFAIGLLLSLLPSRLSWLLHLWAEQQAEVVYRSALSVCAGPELRACLESAARQEHEHQVRFSGMLEP